MIIIQFMAVIVIGYLLGSIPFGVLLIRRRARVDIRDFGSGKTGATNVLRTAGKKKAAICALLDIVKGALAVILAALILGNSYVTVGSFVFGANAAQGLAAIAAIAGHIWPVFLKFRGGRGVAVFFGTMLALSPIVALSGGACLLLIAGLTRYVSLGSIIGAIATYGVLSFLAVTRGFPVEYLTYGLIGTLIIIVMHRDNIERLIAGKERKLGEKAETRELPTAG
jgi:glycerol-3-phosphate acyltransferase PlsY